jgi:hypothetical protein
MKVAFTSLRTVMKLKLLPQHDFVYKYRKRRSSRGRLMWGKQRRGNFPLQETSKHSLHSIKIIARSSSFVCQNINQNLLVFLVKTYGA